ncbi:MAG TPA: hypothetical protein VIV60_04740 [Polyangiaceae bacterium]
MDHAGIPALQDAIRHMHGVESRWLESVEVDETFEGAHVWKGEVQVFELIGHPKTRRCYAWSEASQGNRRRFFAALELPPVDSARAAVRVSIAVDARKMQQ